MLKIAYQHSLAKICEIKAKDVPLPTQDHLEYWLAHWSNLDWIKKIKFVLLALIFTPLVLFTLNYIQKQTELESESVLPPSQEDWDNDDTPVDLSSTWKAFINTLDLPQNAEDQDKPPGRYYSDYPFFY